MSLILAGTIGAGVLTSRGLLGFGMDRVMLRYGTDLIAAYAMFLLLVRIWIWYVKPAPKNFDAGFDDVEGVFDVVDVVSSPGEMIGGRSGGSGSWLPDVDIPDVGDGEGCLILVLLGVLILAMCLAGGYLIYMAPEILGEAAFDAILASSLVHVVNRIEREGWVVGVVRSTLVPFLVVFGFTMALAYGIEHTCPVARTLREALSCPEPRVK